VTGLARDPRGSARLVRGVTGSARRMPARRARELSRVAAAAGGRTRRLVRGAPVTGSALTVPVRRRGLASVLGVAARTRRCPARDGGRVMRSVACAAVGVPGVAAAIARGDRAVARRARCRVRRRRGRRVDGVAAEALSAPRRRASASASMRDTDVPVARRAHRARRHGGSVRLVAARARRMRGGAGGCQRRHARVTRRARRVSCLKPVRRMAGRARGVPARLRPGLAGVAARARRTRRAGRRVSRVTIDACRRRLGRGPRGVVLRALLVAALARARLALVALAMRDVTARARRLRVNDDRRVLVSRLVVARHAGRHVRVRREGVAADAPLLPVRASTLRRMAAPACICVRFAERRAVALAARDALRLDVVDVTVTRPHRRP
jgi:hypothetical protein